MNATDRLRCDIPADWYNDFSQCLFEWQGLEGGLLALAAAAIGVCFVRRQIKQQDRFHNDARRSRFAVAKAKSPLAAIEIADHAREYLTQMERLSHLVLSRSNEQFDFRGPPFPIEASRILDVLVENADDPILVDQIAAMYSEHQVMASRLSRVRPSELGLCIDDYVIQPIMIDALAINLLAYGRDGQTMKPLSWEDVKTRARSLLTDVIVRDQILAYIDDKVKRHRPVPLALRRHSDR